MKTPITELFEKYGHLLPDVQKEFLDKEAQQLQPVATTIGKEGIKELYKEWESKSNKIYHNENHYSEATFPEWLDTQSLPTNPVSEHTIFANFEIIIRRVFARCRPMGLCNMSEEAATDCTDWITKHVQSQPKSDISEEEMEHCECGHIVPLKFSVSDKEGLSTCLKCYTEILSERLRVIRQMNKERDKIIFELDRKIELLQSDKPGVK